jgi:hypothetical protein
MPFEFTQHRKVPVGTAWHINEVRLVHENRDFEMAHSLLSLSTMTIRITWLTAIIANCCLIACGGTTEHISDGGTTEHTSDGGTTEHTSDGGTTEHPSDGGTNLQSCSNLPKPPVLYACAQPVVGWADGIGATRTLAISGTVTAVAAGPVSGGCLAAPAVDNGSSIVALTVRASADGGVDDFDVEYEVPNNGVSWSVGDMIVLNYSHSGGGWLPEKISFTLSHGQMVDVYVGEGSAVSDFSLVPFTFVQGRAVCTESEFCGSWSAHDIEISGSNGNTNIPYGSTVNVNGYRVINGGVREQLSPTTTCSDWYAANASIAVLRDAAAN